MCGFAGVYEYAWGRGTVTEPLVDQMKDTLSHRGPDGEGTWISEDRRVGLGHCRLAIVDPVGGGQPMFGPDGEALVFNGEIYNYPQLRAGLEREGARFRTDCDTEIILQLYRRDPAGFIERLNGMFAFALWDPAAANLVIGRDPIGEKPLYFTDVGGRLVFGSEIKAILAHPGVTAEVDGAAVSPYFANLVAPAPRTLFRGIRKLPPGTVGLCSEGGLALRRYRRMTTARTWSDEPLADSTEHVRGLLESSVEARLMSDVPVGVLLSGGLDSTALVAALSSHGRDLPTFSIGYQGHPETDERRQARAAARHFGTEHHEVELSERAALGFLPHLVHYQDEPVGDPVAVPIHFLCGLARRNGVKVVLAGEGADELFWGYPWYARTLRAWPLIRAALRLPRPLRALLPRLSPDRRKGYMAEALEGVARGRPIPMHCPVGLPRRQRERVLAAGSPLGWESQVRDVGAENPLDTLAFDTQEYEFDLRLPELLLMRIDRFSMSNGVEARVPFLDPDLVDYVYRLPVEQKLVGERTKIVLRRALADLVPRWVIEREKQGFAPPVVSWMQRRFGAVLRILLRDPELGAWIDVEATERLIATGQLGAWPVLNFALWHRHWIRGERLEELIDESAPARASAS